MPLTVEIVTAERVVRTEQGVDVLIAPGSEGQLAILPGHAALMTTLDFGVLTFRRAGQEDDFAIAGGFMEVRRDRVTILADAAEHADEIDIARAEAARTRAESEIRDYRERGIRDQDLVMAQAALQRSLVRLRLAERRRRAPHGAPRPGG